MHGSRGHRRAYQGDEHDFPIQLQQIDKFLFRASNADELHGRREETTEALWMAGLQAKANSAISNAFAASRILFRSLDKPSKQHPAIATKRYTND